MRANRRVVRILLAAALALPLVAGVSGEAALRSGCILRGGFFFDSTPNQFGRFPVLLDVSGICFDQLDVGRDIPVHVNIFLVGSGASMGRCTGGTEIDGLDLNGFYHYEVEGESATINMEAEEWIGRYPFPGPTPFKLMMRYDGTQPSVFPLGAQFAAGLVSTRVFGMCPNGGDPHAQMRIFYSRQP